MTARRGTPTGATPTSAGNRWDANAIVSWAMALGVSPSMSIDKLHDATVALRESAQALASEAEALRAEMDAMRAQYAPELAGQGSA